MDYIQKTVEKFEERLASFKKGQDAVAFTTDFLTHALTEYRALHRQGLGEEKEPKVTHKEEVLFVKGSNSRLHQTLENWKRMGL